MFHDGTLINAIIKSLLFNGFVLNPDLRQSSFNASGINITGWIVTYQTDLDLHCSVHFADKNFFSAEQIVLNIYFALSPSY